MISGQFFTMPPYFEPSNKFNDIGKQVVGSILAAARHFFVELAGCPPMCTWVSSMDVL